jgi:type II secretory pathway component PulF
MASGFDSERMGYQDAMFFCKNISALVSTGVPMEAALSELTRKAPSHMTLVYDQIQSSLKQGKAFWEALEAQPLYFSKTFVTLVQIAEHTGNLPRQLEKIHGELEREMRSEQAFKEMLIMPKWAILVSMLLSTVTFVLLIPFIRSSTEDLNLLNASVHPILAFLFRISDWLSKSFPLSGILLLGGFVFVYAFFTARLFRKEIQSVLGVLPTFSIAMQSSGMTRFFRGLSLLIGGGIPISSCLKMAGEMSSHPEIKEVGVVLAYLVDKGSNLEEAFRRCDYFESSVVARVATLEKTGDYESMFEDTARYYENESGEQFLKARRQFKVIIMSLAVVFAMTQVGILIFTAFNSLSGIFGGL